MDLLTQLRNMNIASVSFVNLYRDTASSYPMHNRGRWCHGLLLPLEGVEHYRFSDGECDLSPSKVLYIPKGEDYIIELKGGDSAVICIDFSLLAEDIAYRPLCISLTDTRTLRPLFQEALSLWKRNPPSRDLALKSVLYAILSHLVTEQSRAHPSGCHPRLALALEHLRTHFTDPDLSVEALATLSGMSRRYFDKLFRETMGLSPRDYLIRLKIDLAKELLRSERFTAGEVALTVGYADPYHFSKIFKQKTGRTPTEYKREG